jgi:hypothetical protein
MDLRHVLLSSVSVLALIVAAGAVADTAALAEERAPLPAVSGLNAKIGGFGAGLGEESAGGGFVGLSFPLWWGLGAQIDGIVGNGSSGDFHGVGGHLFWRDPSRGLLGVYGSHFRWDGGSGAGGEVGKIGLEGQLYLGRMSLEGLSGYQFGSESGWTGKGTVAYYPHDDFRVHLGVSQRPGPGFAGFAGLEWAPMPRRGLSLFADIGVGEDRDLRSLVGLKFYFSPQDKSLIRRHREDDPDLDLPSDLFQALQAHGVCPAGRILINGFCDGNL